jgi:hypothetical protein
MFELCPSSVFDIKLKDYVARREWVPVLMYKSVSNTNTFGPERQSYFGQIQNIGITLLYFTAHFNIILPVMSHLH